MFAVEADKIEELRGQGRLGRADAAQEDRRRLADRRAGADEGGRGRGVGDHERPRVARDPARRRREAGRPRRSTAWPSRASRWRSSGGRRRRPIRPSCSSATRRRRAATCTRSAAASRRCSWSPAYLESTFNKTTFDLRDKTILTFERDKVDAVEIVAADRTSCSSRRPARTGGWRSRSRRGRLRHRRGPDRPRADGADEGDRRAGRRRSRSSTASTSPSVDRDDRRGQLAGDAASSARRARPARSTRGTSRGRWSSPSSRAWSTT